MYVRNEQNKMNESRYQTIFGLCLHNKQRVFLKRPSLVQQENI